MAASSGFKLKRIKVMKILLSTIFLCCQLMLLYGNTAIIEHTFNWDDQPLVHKLADGQSVECYTFEGSAESEEFPGLSFLIKTFPLPATGTLRLQVLETQYEAMAWQGVPDNAFLGESLQFETATYRNREGAYGKIAFSPIVRRGSGFERLTYIKLRATVIPESQSIVTRDPVFNSVLSEGPVYKIAVTQDGVYKLTYDFLKNDLGMDLDNIDPRNIQLYGNGGGILPTFVGTARIDDLQENRIVIVGESDGNFDGGDYILFYGQGPDAWQLNEEDQIFNFQKNIYDTRNYYFIKVAGEPGIRAQNQSSITNTAYTTSTFNDFSVLNEDKVNIFHDWAKAQGSGQRWFGDHFKVARDYRYDDVFNFPNLDASAPVHVRASMILRSNRSSSFQLNINGETLTSSTASAVTQLSGPNDNTIPYAHNAAVSQQLLLASGQIDLTVEYPFPSGAAESEGWLDFVQFNARRDLRVTGNQMHFRDLNTRDYATSTFQIGDINNNYTVWDISDPLAPAIQEGTASGNSFSFGVNTASLRTFIAFHNQDGLLTAEAVGAIENQNVHGVDNVDMVIITPEAFEQEALRLAQHRQDHSGLRVAVVHIHEVFNEFASGRKDPTAIRDFAKMLYERSSEFRYILLFGDGSFDPRDIYGLGNDFIPVYENDSLNPIFSYPSDDYYVLLTGTDEDKPLGGDLNLAIGRLPVNTTEQARLAVDKIIKYDTDPKSFLDWRNRMVYVGDDEDFFTHAPKADNIADIINNITPAINTNKIYLDAYPQVSTPGGDRFPKATEAINSSIFKGALAITYLGHGGSEGWAQERVLNISDINSWTNADRQPLFITATCSFAGYDDAGFTTAGELVFLNPRGGAIGLLTTVRAVYANPNSQLTEEVLRRLYDLETLGRPMTLGEVMQYGKNGFTSTSVTTNSRKFTLIGDPAQYLAVPRFNVATTQIDGQPITTGVLDTIGALQKVLIEGVVTDDDGNIMDFDGVIYPTIYDKKTVNFTLGQDESSPVFDYELQNNVIFKGRASVVDGRFQFTFVVPKDINYQFGTGKISYYAADTEQMIDAAGSYEDIIIGGTSPDALADDQGPRVDVFMNTQDFAFGGITDANPTLLVVLEDDNGINVVGNSIGHDLEGVLDNNTQNTYLLNDFYESDLDDFTKGQVRYPLSDLEEGRHEIRVKAWDIANNSSEGYTEFVVASSENIALEHVLNYPNPFTDYTCFQFDHNLANQELDILINIYTVSGRLVKTLEATILSDGAIRRDDCVEWDGKDDYGDQLARGVYLYRVEVRTSNTGTTTLTGESEFEKLVILK
jgi:hypothetical protein